MSLQYYSSSKDIGHTTFPPNDLEIFQVERIINPKDTYI